jgi:putative membrane protein insertion efficiency factor
MTTRLRPAGVAAPTPEPAPDPAPDPTVAARAVVGLIRCYQLARTGRTSPCRFVPTCSHYAATAVERHGLRRGLRLALGRLGRCRPGGPFGSDPVPE